MLMLAVGMLYDNPTTEKNHCVCEERSRHPGLGHTHYSDWGVACAIVLQVAELHCHRWGWRGRPSEGSVRSGILGGALQRIGQICLHGRLRLSAKRSSACAA